MIGTCADISDFSHPVLRELVLHSQIPLHDSRHAPHRASGAHDTAGMTWVCKRNGWRKSGGYQLAPRGGQPRIEGAGRKRQLGRIQAEAIENVAVARVEDT